MIELYCPSIINCRRSQFTSSRICKKQHILKKTHKCLLWSVLYHLGKTKMNDVKLCNPPLRPPPQYPKNKNRPVWAFIHVCIYLTCICIHNHFYQVSRVLYHRLLEFSIIILTVYGMSQQSSSILHISYSYLPKRQGL